MYSLMSLIIKFCFKYRYILYDVNPSEGFNLRRDVYIRVATFIKELIKNDRKLEWNVVLPPWGKLIVPYNFK
jgi:hypothetical protein